MTFHCRINEQAVTGDVADRTLLSDFLRHELRLTGTHVGCEMGACGACTVLLDGQPVRSCLIFAAQTDGAEVLTVEGIRHHPWGPVIHRAFSRHHALQCGYCTPGILTTLIGAMERGLLPESEEEIRVLLSGNLCRCTGYQGLVDAVLELRQHQLSAQAS